MYELLFIINMILSFLTGGCIVGEVSSMSSYETATIKSTYVECSFKGEQNYIIIENGKLVDWGP